VFIEDSYNCRKGKGTDYGVKRAAYFANKYSDGWILICDLKGFFMSINKKLLWDKLK
jgi:retron-type reverse transcriptase